MKLFDDQGRRLYLNTEERSAFMLEAKKQSGRDRMICETFHFTGCRPSELIEVTPARVDLSEYKITFRKLKKRKDANGKQVIKFRSVPVPEDYFDRLCMVYDLRELQKSKKTADLPIWDSTRQRLGQIVTPIMLSAGIVEGPHRCLKGLRHGFGVNAVTKEIPLNMVQKWMGHEKMETTAIYANAIGREERNIATRMWN